MRFVTSSSGCRRVDRASTPPAGISIGFGRVDTVVEQPEACVDTRLPPPMTVNPRRAAHLASPFTGMNCAPGSMSNEGLRVAGITGLR
jgi:hypothetical protein